MPPTASPTASNCTALVRAQLQVPNGYGGWRVIRALGRHRIDVCQGSSGRWTTGDFWVRMGATYLLRSQPARVCWSATQNVNGVPSTHVSCKRFVLRGGS